MAGERWLAVGGVLFAAGGRVDCLNCELGGLGD